MPRVSCDKNRRTELACHLTWVGWRTAPSHLFSWMEPQLSLERCACRSTWRYSSVLIWACLGRNWPTAVLIFVRQERDTHGMQKTQSRDSIRTEQHSGAGGRQLEVWSWNGGENSSYRSVTAPLQATFPPRTISVLTHNTGQAHKRTPRPGTRPHDDALDTQRTPRRVRSQATPRPRDRRRPGQRRAKTAQTCTATPRPCNALRDGRPGHTTDASATQPTARRRPGRAADALALRRRPGQRHANTA